MWRIYWLLKNLSSIQLVFTVKLLTGTPFGMLKCGLTAFGKIHFDHYGKA
jgi:hypothetical protein